MNYEFDDRPITLSDLLEYEVYCNTHRYRTRKGILWPLQQTTKGFIEWIKSREHVTEVSE